MPVVLAQLLHREGFSIEDSELGFRMSARRLRGLTFSAQSADIRP